MTVELDTTTTKLVLALIVVVAGAIGGVAADLLKSRNIRGANEDGVIEGSRQLTSRYYDAGTWASVLLGIVSAAIAMALLNPIEEVAAVAPSTEVTEQYDIWRVLALTLIAGISAPKFLATMQERFLALATQERLATALGAVEKTVQAGEGSTETKAAVSEIVADNLGTPTANN